MARACAILSGFMLSVFGSTVSAQFTYDVVRVDSYQLNSGNLAYQGQSYRQCPPEDYEYGIDWEAGDADPTIAVNSLGGVIEATGQRSELTMLTSVNNSCDHSSQCGAPFTSWAFQVLQESRNVCSPPPSLGGHSWVAWHLGHDLGVGSQGISTASAYLPVGIPTNSVGNLVGYFDLLHSYSGSGPHGISAPPTAWSMGAGWYSNYTAFSCGVSGKGGIEVTCYWGDSGVEVEGGYTSGGVPYSLDETLAPGGINIIWPFDVEIDHDDSIQMAGYSEHAGWTGATPVIGSVGDLEVTQSALGSFVVYQ